MPKIEEYNQDIVRLASKGFQLYYALFKEHGNETDKERIPASAGKLPSFSLGYQPWFSESLALLRQLAPERVEDFRAYYTPKTQRREISFANYTISDCLRGLVGRMHGSIEFEPRSAAQGMLQQATVIDGLRNRFKSTLYDIKTLVHADLLDDELHAAEVLNKNGFARGAGAVAGVVLEGHLKTVCERHKVTPSKKNPTLSDYYEALRAADVIDIIQWRFIQHLGDIRNKCDHKKDEDPSKIEITDLIEGVRKIAKTVF